MSQRGFSDTLSVVLPHLRSHYATFAAKLDALKNKLIGAFLEITPEVISNPGKTGVPSFDDLLSLFVS